MRKEKAAGGRKVKAGRTSRAKAGARNVSALEAQVQKHFGVLPNFFRLAPENPEIAANLWGFASFAYLDNPLPSLFKERLFVYLSRFCEVRYCIARHVGFLAGLGHASGDRKSPRQTIEEIVRLLRRPLARGEELEHLISRCKEDPSLFSLVDPYSKAIRAKSARVEHDEEAEEVIFGLASHVFLQTTNAPACLDALRAVLGESRLQHLMVFLAFVRTAHYWTRVHPELTLEDDIKELLKTHEVLAQCVLGEPEAVPEEVSRRLLDELALLRKQTERESGLLAAIVDSSDDAIVSKNLDGFITSWNKGAERVFGYTAQEAVGQHITLIIPPERRDEETGILEQLRRGERVDHFETVRVRKDGAKVDISLTISPLRDAAGRVIGASKVARDITRHKQAERSLAEQAGLLDLSTDAILVRDPTDKITYWNKGAAELYGYTREEALGRVSHELLRTQFPAPLERITEYVQREGRWTGELIHKRKDESEIVVISRWALDQDDRGNPRAILETNNDMTARKQAENALRGSQNRLAIEVASLKLLQDISTQLIHEENVKTLYEKITDAAMTIMGSDYASLQVLDRQTGDSGELLLLAYRGFNARAAQFWERVPDYTGSTCAAALRTGERVIASDVEKCVFMSGTEDLATYLQTGIHAVQSTPLLSRTGQVVGMISTHWRQVHTPDERELQVFDVLARQAADIIERRRAEEALRESEERLRVLADGLEAQVRMRTSELEERNKEMLERTEQLQQLSNRLLRVQDDERRHIARELHDSVGQYLSGLLMVIGEAQREIPGNSNLEEAAQIARDCSGEIRTMSHLLHPPLLEEAGLASAVKWFADGFAARSGIRAEVEIARPLRRMAPERELALFRVLQESLTNVHRHSGSKTVRIRIGADSERVWLEVEDHGRGASNGFGHAGVGITGMRERLESLGGELGISSNGNGTRVRAVLPLTRSNRTAKAAVD